MTLFILSMVIALSISFICSLMEACLLSLSTSDVAVLSERRPGAGRTWRQFKENLQKPIAVILIANTLAHTIGASVSGAEFSRVFGLGPKWVFLFSIVFSVAMIEWTELIPKILGVRYNRHVAALTAWPMRIAVKIMSPVVSVFELMNRPFEAGGEKTRLASKALDEISLLTRFAQINNLITKEQEGIVARSIKLSHSKVSNIMVERKDIKYLSTSMHMMDALIESHIHHHTRYPLVQGNNLDDVVGYVNVKDIMSALQTNPRDPSLRGIARPIMVIKADQNAAVMLRELTKGYQHIAVVKNERNETVGLVTLEDVVESIVGDIEDEYDILPGYVYPICDGRFLVGGGISMRALREKTGADIPDENISVNDWLSSRLPGHMRAEAEVRWNDWVFIVRKVRRSRVYEAIVEKRPAATAGG